MNVVLQTYADSVIKFEIDEIENENHEMDIQKYLAHNNTIFRAVRIAGYNVRTSDAPWRSSGDARGNVHGSASIRPDSRRDDCSIRTVSPDVRTTDDGVLCRVRCERCYSLPAPYW